MTIAFATGALLLSSVLALGTYLTARHLLVQQREQTATRQAFIDAALVRDNLLTPGTSVSDVLGSLSPPAGATVYLRRGDTWYSSALETSGPETTRAVQPFVEEGDVGVAWTDSTDPHSVVVGVPLPAVGADYFEVVVADELDETLWTLGLALGVSAALTTLAGAVVGRLMSRRVITPLTDVSEAAVRVSRGDMHTHLDDTTDPDLAGLVASFNHMVDAVRDRIEHETRFAADVSHELRTPVTTLTTSLSLLEHDPDLSPRASRAVRLMAEELARFRQALTDLLALGRLDAGAHETTPSGTDVRDLVRQTLASAGHPASVLASDRSHDESQGSGPHVVVDRSQVARALLNLYRNADLHGGGLDEVAVHEVGDAVEIRVCDRGPGVPDHEHERIFERFARAGGQKQGTGSGLGLSIVEQTARNHGGSVRCENRDGGGATFVLSLPRSRS